MTISTVLLPIGYVAGLLGVFALVGKLIKSRNQTTPFGIFV
jgi:hypothetical protein